MTASRPLTRADLSAMLDEIFVRILRDGEIGRAHRLQGAAPPWTPEPLEDPRYEDVEPEDWNSVPSEPEANARDWLFSVMLNRVADVLPFVDDAMTARGASMNRDTLSWRRFVRLAVIAAADAYNIDASREHGNYSAGWPQSAGIPLAEIPEPIGGIRTETRNQNNEDSLPDKPDVPLFSASFASFMAQKQGWVGKTREQAAALQVRFISLMGDLPITTLTRDIAERFRNRLHEIPAMIGRGPYAKATAMEAVLMARKIKEQLGTGATEIELGQKVFSRDKAISLTQEISLKTINRDLSFLVHWGKWMEKSDERRALFPGGRSPFGELLHAKRDVAKEARRAGRTRTPFDKGEMRLILGNLSTATIDGSAKDDDLKLARYWSVLIAAYTGMRLGEIAELRPSDFKTESGIQYINLTEEKSRHLKTEAGTRVIPLHPSLIERGLLDLVKFRKTRKLLLPGATSTSPDAQSGGRVSKWFLGWRRSLGLPSRKTPFHAFRHTVAHELRSLSKGRDALVDQILGHEPGSIGAKVYTHDLPLEAKADLIASLDYSEREASNTRQ